MSNDTQAERGLAGAKQGDSYTAATSRRPAAAPENSYAVIYADPPWRFRTWSETNQNRAVSNHYSLMSLADIKAVPWSPTGSASRSSSWGTAGR